MTVLIAGAGIGGLTLALSLQSVGIKSKIFEATKTIRPLGVGINLQPHAIRELEALGLLPQLDNIALRTKEVSYFSTQGQEIWSEPRGMFAGYNWPQFSIHRGRLQMLLFNEVQKRLGEDAIVTGAAVKSWQETGDQIEVNLYDRINEVELGSEKGSLLIGADGIHSTMRSTYYPNEGLPVWGGIVMWRGVTKTKSFLSGRTMAMAGCKQRKFVCYPIEEEGGVTTINWIADLARPADYIWNREDWNRAGKTTDFLSDFEKWKFDWLDIPGLIESAESIFEFPMVDRDPLPKWTFGKTTLLGDAAHPMYPIGSNGATQAIIDARVLTRELLHHGIGEAALKSYEAERREVTSKIVLANRGDGPDKVMDIIEERAPDGYGKLEDILSKSEMAEISASYKNTAGFGVEALNSAKPILSENTGT